MLMQFSLLNMTPKKTLETSIGLQNFPNLSPLPLLFSVLFLSLLLQVPSALNTLWSSSSVIHLEKTFLYDLHLSCLFTWLLLHLVSAFSQSSGSVHAIRLANFCLLASVWRFVKYSLDDRI